MHEGAIGFTSTKGVDSTFSFYVEIRKTSAKSTPAGDQNAEVDKSVRSVINNRPHNAKDEPWRESTIPTGIEVVTKDLHILIFEDNLVIQRVLARELWNLGIQIVVANHGGEALDHLRQTSYCISDDSAKPLSLILMD